MLEADWSMARLARLFGSEPELTSWWSWMADGEYDECSSCWSSCCDGESGSDGMAIARLACGGDVDKAEPLKDSNDEAAAARDSVGVDGLLNEELVAVVVIVLVLGVSGCCCGSTGAMT